MPIGEYTIFSGRLVLQTAPWQLKADQLQVCDNADMSIQGIVKAYRGRRVISTFPYTVKDLFWQNIFPTDSFMSRAETVVYDGTTPILWGLPDRECRFLPFASYLVIVNGVNNYKYKQTGIVGMNQVCFSQPWEAEHAAKLARAGAFKFWIHSASGASCSQPWEVDHLDGKLPSEQATGSALLATTEMVKHMDTATAGVANLVATQGTHTDKIVVSWDPDTSATGYNIKHGSDPDSLPTTVALPVTQTTYEDTATVVGLPHFYSVQKTGGSWSGPVMGWRARTSDVEALEGQLLRRPVQLGITAPSTAATVAAGAGTGLTGVYKYKVTFLNSDAHESNPSPVATTASLVNKDVAMTALPLSTDPQVVKRRIYRTKAGLEVFYELKDINDNHTTTYTDSAADSTLVESETLLIDQDVPPAAIDAVEHLSILFLLQEPNILWWADAWNRWEAFEATNFEPFGSEANQGRRLAVLGEEIAIFTNVDIWRRTGTSEASFLKKRSLSNRGTCSTKGIASRGDAIAFVDAAGIFYFDTIRDILVSLPVMELFNPNGSHARRAALTTTSLARCCMEYMDGLLMLSYASVSSPDGEPDMILLHDILNKSFGFLTLDHVTEITTNPVTKKFYVARQANVLELFSGLTNEDTGEDIWFEIQTKDFGRELGSGLIRKSFEWFKFDGDPKSGTLEITVLVDGVVIKTLQATTAGVLRRRLSIATTGYHISFRVRGTRDAEFYGLGFSFEEAEF